MTTDALREAVELDTLEQFDALLSPIRLRLTELLVEPATAKEVAGVLGVPVTRLYYHLNALVDQGIIEVVDERPKGAMVERVFRVAGAAFRPSSEFIERYGVDGLAEVTALTFRHAETRFTDALREGLFGDERNAEVRRGTIGLMKLNLTPSRLDELVRRLEGLVQEFDDEPTGNDLTISWFNAVSIRKDMP